MREFHVIFMYYALPLLMRFPEHLRDATSDECPALPDDDEDIPEDSTSGKALLTTMKHLLRGLHLTKGFTSEVCVMTTEITYA